MVLAILYTYLHILYSTCFSGTENVPVIPFVSGNLVKVNYKYIRVLASRKKGAVYIPGNSSLHSKGQSAKVDMLSLYTALSSYLTHSILNISESLFRRCYIIVPARRRMLEAYPFHTECFPFDMQEPEFLQWMCGR